MTTRMLEEALEAPAAIARQLGSGDFVYSGMGAQLRAEPPRSLLTIARGSSDHAAHFAAYLIMARLGQLVTSLPMSLITLYESHLDTAGMVALAFSQSGQSPDLVEPAAKLGARGALTAAFVNDDQSPLALNSQWVFPLQAGQESSVAATKSYIAQLVAGARLVSAWQQDAGMKAAIQGLPDVLAKASRQDWSAALEVLHDADRLMVIGRGTGLAIAMEAALKLKETCAIQAEAFSGAEVQHGPMALVDEGYPMLIFAPRGPAQPGLIALADAMRERGARVLLAAPPGTPGASLPLTGTADADLDPISAIMSFYPMVEALSRARGMDPDTPRHLAKVTRTH